MPGTSAPLPSASPATPAPGATVTPSAAPTLNFTFHYIPHPAASPAPQPGSPAPQTGSSVPAAPQILEVDLNSNPLVSGEEIDIRVLTTPDVVKVVSGSGSHSGVVPKVGEGVFIAVSKLPKLPFFAHGIGYNLEVTASTADGRSTSVKVPVHIK